MGKKITVNIRFNIAAPYGYKEKDLTTSIKKFFDKRGYVKTVKDMHKYLITSYRFRGNIQAEIKIKIHYTKEGTIRSFDTLGTFDSYKKDVVENINEYRSMVLGFIKYLNEIKYGWFIDVFVFRLYPVDFIRQYDSRIGTGIITDVYLILRIKGADYCIIKGDRVEYRCSDWQKDTINNIMTIITKYTRK